MPGIPGWLKYLTSAPLIFGAPIQRRHRLLVIFIALFAIFTISLRLVMGWLDAQIWSGFYVSVIVLLLASILLATTSYHWLAAMILVGVVYCLPYAALLSDEVATHPDLFMMYTIISVITTYLLFGVFPTAVIALVNFLVVAFAASLEVDLGITEKLLAVGLVGIASILAVVAAVFRYRDQEEINRQTQAVSESEMRFRALIDAAFETIMLHDNGRLIDINRAGEELFGYRKNEVVGIHLSDLLTETLSMPTVQSWEDEDLLIPFESVGLHKDGTSFPVEVLTKGYVYQGRSVHVSAVRDITFRKQTESILRNQMMRTEIIANVSQRLASLSGDELDAGISDVLRMAGEFMNASHGAVFLLNIEVGEPYQTYTWDAPDADQPHVDVETPEWRWWMDRLHSFQSISATLDELPEEAAIERDALTASGAQSVIGVPMIYRQTLVGFLRFTWSYAFKAVQTENTAMLMVLAEIIVNVLERAQAEQALRQSEQRFSQVFHTSPIATILSTIEDGRFIDVNQSFLDLTDYTRDEVIGQTSLDLKIWPSHESRERFIRSVRDNASKMQVESTLRVRSGELREVLNSVEVIELNGQECLLSLFLDITERKKAEAQLMTLELERERVDVLQQFISDASHDFKTPLSIMNTSLYLIKKRSAEQDVVHKHVETMELQVQRMQQLLDDFLTMSRLDRAQAADFQFQHLNLNQVAREAIDGQSTLIQKKRHEVRFVPDTNIPTILMDALTIRQAVDNLLVNACTYTPDGGVIEVLTYRKALNVILEVRDNGIGIDQDDLPLIFNRFYRADKARPSSVAGTGLGLSIVRRIIEAHMGQIEVESTPGKGSSFRVVLPITALVNQAVNS